VNLNGERRRYEDYFQEIFQSEGGPNMKRWSVIMIFLAAAFICLTIVSGPDANAQEKLRYSCCYQAYEAIEKERINAFTKETGIPVDVTVMSSTSAYKYAINNASDIGSITLKALSFRQLGQFFVMIPFCQDGIAVIADPKCDVNDLSETQLRDIFSGEIVNWKVLGGPDHPITTVVPREETGAYINFDRMVMKGKNIKYHVKTYESTKIMDVVAHLPGAISFISQADTVNREGIKILKVDNLLPSDRKYPYVQVFYFISAQEPVGPAKAFIDFAFSEKGVDMIKRKGMYPLQR
jgi:phosphate transport system substrate-binding protein